MPTRKYKGSLDALADDGSVEQDGEKVWVCDVCQQIYDQQHELREHQENRSHWGRGFAVSESSRARNNRAVLSHAAVAIYDFDQENAGDYFDYAQRESQEYVPSLEDAEEDELVDVNVPAPDLLSNAFQNRSQNSRVDQIHTEFFKEVELERNQAADVVNTSSCGAIAKRNNEKMSQDWFFVEYSHTNKNDSDRVYCLYPKCSKSRGMKSNDSDGIPKQLGGSKREVWITSNIHRHLINKHMTWYVDNGGKLSEKERKENKAVVSSSMNKFVVSNMRPKTDKRSKESVRIREFLVDYVVTGNMPASVVNNSSLRAAFEIAIPGLPHLDRHTVKDYILEKYKKSQEVLRRLLAADGRFVWLTVDGWTSRVKMGYFAVSASFITAQFEMVSVLMDVEALSKSGSYAADRGHTGQNLSNAIKNVCERFNTVRTERNDDGDEVVTIVNDVLQRVVGITGDGAANVQSISSYLDGDANVHHCAAHALQLAMKDLYETCIPAKQVIGICHGIAVIISASQRMSQQIGRPVMAVKTRFNSMVDCVRSVNEMWNKIGEYIEKYKSTSGSDNNFKKLKELYSRGNPQMQFCLVKALSVPAMPVDVLGSSQTVTGSMVIPFANGMIATLSKQKNAYERQNGTPQQVLNWTAELKKCLLLRIVPIAVSHASLCAMLLDYRFEHGKQLEKLRGLIHDYNECCDESESEKIQTEDYTEDNVWGLIFDKFIKKAMTVKDIPIDLQSRRESAGTRDQRSNLAVISRQESSTKGTKRRRVNDLLFAGQQESDSEGSGESQDSSESNNAANSDPAEDAPERQLSEREKIAKLKAQFESEKAMFLETASRCCQEQKSSSGNTLSPLEFWRDRTRSSKMPFLAMSARRFLVYQASEVECERVFRLTGQIISPLRARMQPATMRARAFLGHNGKRLKLFEAEVWRQIRKEKEAMSKKRLASASVAIANQ